MKVDSFDGEIPGGARRLREAVFVAEQGVPPEVEWDGRDDEAVHAVATEGDVVVGTARMREVGGAAKVERVAVAPSHRRKGVGRALVLHLEDAARRRGLARVVLNAQERAVPFWSALGYAPVGEPFVEAGIPHRAMERALPGHDGSAEARGPGAR